MDKRILAISAVLVSGCAGGPRTRDRCEYSRMQCIVFWKAGGREFMGGATEPCDWAKDYVERNNKAMGEGAYWYREILVNASIDTASDCRRPGETASTEKWRPAVRAAPKSGEGM